MNQPLSADPGRRAHFGHFYGIEELLAGGDRPFAVVVGNCQSGSVRRLLDGDDCLAVRIPPVHELDGDDVPPLQSLLQRADLLVAQPVVTDYRGLPVGTEQLQELLPPGSRTVLWPSLWYSGTLPYQDNVRHPSEPDAVPDLVPYHDLRTVIACAVDHGVLAADRAGDLDAPLDADVARRVAEESVTTARRRAGEQGTIDASDLLGEPHAGLFHTVNHPSNRVLAGVVDRIRAAAGLGPLPPDRVPADEMLGGILTPVEPAVADALEVEPDPSRPDPPTGNGHPDWMIGGRRVPHEEVVAAHTAWYADHPQFLQAGLDRHGDRMRLMGLLRD